jgi:hypothetical protein
MPELFEVPARERGQQIGPAARRAGIALLAVVVAVAPAGVFGQPQHADGVTADAASMRLSAPRTVRGGLFFEARLDIDAPIASPAATGSSSTAIPRSRRASAPASTSSSR